MIGPAARPATGPAGRPGPGAGRGSPDNRAMNPRLARLHPYPFERWRELTRDLVPNPDFAPLSLGIGEPRHAAPALVEQALAQALPTLSSYPATQGEPALRRAIAGWVQRR